MSKPRAYTPEELRSTFLSLVADYVDYWATLDSPKDTRERLEGLAFSMLVIIDGGSATLPGFSLIPTPHPTDKEYNVMNGSNYIPEDVDIGGSLHDNIHKHFKLSKP